MARNYSNIALDTTLTAGIAEGDLSFVVASASGWPAAPFAAVLDPGLVTEEVVQVTAKAGTTFTATRGFDGTTAAAHALGATVRHAAIAGDFTDLQAANTTEASTRAAADSAHAALTTGAHGGIVASTDPRLTDSRTPTGAAGGVLGGTYPNPAFAADMATQVELDAEATARASADTTNASNLTAHEADTTAVHGIADTSALYRAGGTDVALADGGTGASLADPNADRILFWDDSAGAFTWLTAGTNLTITDTTIDAAAGGISDGDKGDITVSASGATWTIDNDAVSFAKMQNVSATDKVLGRSTAGAGDTEEIAFTAAARALADDTTAAAMLITLGAQTAIAEGRPKTGATIYYSLPGIVPTASVGTQTLAANIARYMPICVLTPITLDQLAVEVTTAGAASTTARLGIYNADTDWQPTSLVVDAGTVLVDSTGVKTAAISQVLTPGRYVLALNTDSAALIRAQRGMHPQHGLLTTLGASPLILTMTVAQAYAALPSTGTAWDTVSGNSVGLNYFVFCRVSTP